ncbi:helix-turn-helix transcriptional regulator [Methylorubrum extorquens]
MTRFGQFHPQIPLVGWIAPAMQRAIPATCRRPCSSGEAQRAGPVHGGLRRRDCHPPLAQAQLPGLSVLEGLFDLTPAEARVARGITGCRTVEQIATKFGTSPQTVRSQLKNVMANTGVNRQAELVSLLSGAVLPRS